MTQRGNLTPYQRKELVAARAHLSALTDPLQAFGAERETMQRIEELIKEIESILGY